MSIKITCICKADGNHENAYAAIESMSWVDVISREKGHATRTAMYNYISSGNVAFVEDAQGRRAQLLVAETQTGTRYVKTKAEVMSDDYLLALPRCPDH